MNNNKGFSLLVLIIAVAIVALASVWYSLYSQGGSPLDITGIRRTLRETQDIDNAETAADFEPIPEDEYTPAEINNEALEELDNIVKSLKDEDLSDLSDL